MNAPFQLRCGDWLALGEAASRVRLEVFVNEQHVPASLELDEWDPLSLHCLILDADQPLATGRLLPDGHIGRMAVRAPWRGQGLGSRVLQALMEQGRARGDREFVLSAQCHAVPFYLRHGFEAFGERYLEAGIEHVSMRHVVSRAP